MTDDIAELVKEWRHLAEDWRAGGETSGNHIVDALEKAATALESLATPVTDEWIVALLNKMQEEVPYTVPEIGGFPAWIVAAVRLAARPQTITVPKPTPDQAEYLERIAAGQKYDPETVVGGPARPQTVTEATDAVLETIDAYVCRRCIDEGGWSVADASILFKKIQSALAAVPPRASDTRPDLADLNYLRKPFPAPPPTSQWQTEAIDDYLTGLRWTASDAGAHKDKKAQEEANLVIGHIEVLRTLILAGPAKALPAPPTEQDKP
jgi:hypothetical protein